MIRDALRFRTMLCSEHIIRNSIEKRTYAKEKAQRKFFEKTLCDKQTQVLRTQERKIAMLSPVCQTPVLRTEGRMTTMLSAEKVRKLDKIWLTSEGGGGVVVVEHEQEIPTVLAIASSKMARCCAENAIILV